MRPSGPCLCRKSNGNTSKKSSRKRAAINIRLPKLWASTGRPSIVSLPKWKAVTPKRRSTTDIGAAVTDFRLPEEPFRLAVEFSPSGMLMVDRHGTIVLVNRQLEQQFGYHRNQLIGQSIEVLVPPRFRPVHIADRERYMKLASARPMGKGRELYGLRKDG